VKSIFLAIVLLSLGQSAPESRAPLPVAVDRLLQQAAPVVGQADIHALYHDYGVTATIGYVSSLLIAADPASLGDNHVKGLFAILIGTIGPSGGRSLALPQQTSTLLHLLQPQCPLRGEAAENVLAVEGSEKNQLLRAVEGLVLTETSSYNLVKELSILVQHGAHDTRTLSRLNALAFDSNARASLFRTQDSPPDRIQNWEEGAIQERSMLARLASGLLQVDLPKYAKLDDRGTANAGDALLAAFRPNRVASGWNEPTQLSVIRTVRDIFMKPERQLLLQNPPVGIWMASFSPPERFSVTVRRAMLQAMLDNAAASGQQKQINYAFQTIHRFGFDPKGFAPQK